MSVSGRLRMSQSVKLTNRNGKSVSQGSENIICRSQENIKTSSLRVGGPLSDQSHWTCWLQNDWVPIASYCCDSEGGSGLAFFSQFTFFSSLVLGVLDLMPAFSLPLGLELSSIRGGESPPNLRVVHFELVSEMGYGVYGAAATAVRMAWQKISHNSWLLPLLNTCCWTTHAAKQSSLPAAYCDSGPKVPPAVLHLPWATESYPLSSDSAPAVTPDSMVVSSHKEPGSKSTWPDLSKLNHSINDKNICLKHGTWRPLTEVNKFD